MSGCRWSDYQTTRTQSVIIRFLKCSLSINFVTIQSHLSANTKRVIMQLLLPDFDLFALQFYFLEIEIHLDVNKVCGLFSLSPMWHAMKGGADRHAAAACTTRRCKS